MHLHDPAHQPRRTGGDAGVRLRPSRFLFEPNTVATLRLIQQEVIQSLAQWEPRIAINDVTAALNATDQRAVDVTITYTLIATSSQERLTMTVGLNT